MNESEEIPQPALRAEKRVRSLMERIAKQGIATVAGARDLEEIDLQLLLLLAQFSETFPEAEEAKQLISEAISETERPSHFHIHVGASQPAQTEDQR